MYYIITMMIVYYGDILYMPMMFVFKVQCPVLSNPMNGDMYCLLMDGIMAPSYGEICTFACNTGYELTGSDTRTCQSNGSWNGTDTICKRGIIIVLS